jgi:multicomponent Na+:H+ antiporter subunit B
VTQAGSLAETEPRHRAWIALLLVAGVAAVIVAAMVSLPRERAPLSAVAHQALAVAEPRWHLTEPVNEVVYGTRGFDTFGETFLLLAAVVSVVVLARHREPREGFIGEAKEGEQEQESEPPVGAEDESERRARRAEASETEEEDGPPETPDTEPVGLLQPETARAMTVVTRTAARTAAVVLAVAGCYLCAWGYTPGGGFPAGAVILGVAMLAYAGFGYPRVSRVIRPAVVEVVEVAGALLIIGVEVLGLFLRGSVSRNWLPLAPLQTIRSGGVAQLFSAGELVEVATGLILAIFTLLAMRHDWARDSDGEEHEAGS